jgi:hypothetical protein
VVVGTSLFQLLFTTAGVSVTQAGVSQAVDPLLAVILVLGSAFGTQWGARTGMKLPAERLRLILALVVVGVALKMLLSLLLAPEDVFHHGAGGALRRRTLLALLVALAAAVARPAVSVGHLVSHLDVDHVDVSARFQGQSILLFGAVSWGTDVVIEVVSPEQEVELASRSRFGPVWLESGHVTVSGAPGLIYLLSSRPIGTLLGTSARQALGLTLNGS